MEWPWHTSKKGQLYTRNRDGSRVAIIWADPVRDLYTYSLSPLDDSTQWERSSAKYSTLDDAKRGALVALGVIASDAPVRTPLQASPAESPPLVTRRIVL